jgi:integrase
METSSKDIHIIKPGTKKKEKNIIVHTSLKTLTVRIPTKKPGVYYKEIEKTIIDDKGNTKTTIDDKVYLIRYKDKNDTWKFKTIGKYSEGIREEFCNTKRIELVNQLKLGEQPTILKDKLKKNIITFDSIAKKYFDSVEGINRNNKLTTSRYELHIKPFIGHLDISQIDYSYIETIQKAKQKTHAPQTVNSIKTLAGTIFNYAINKLNMKIYNPASKVDSLEVDNTRLRFLNKEEINALLDEVAKDETLNLFTRLSLSTGGRASTIMNIKKKDINMENHTINLFDFKNNTSYIGFITDDLIPIMKDLLPTLKSNDSLISKYVLKTIQNKMKVILDTLFNGDSDEKLKANDSKYRVVPHTLRHTYASHLAMNGTPIYTIQKLMNHKDINMTLRYAKLAPDNGKIEVKGLYK